MLTQENPRHCSSRHVNSVRYHQVTRPFAHWFRHMWSSARMDCIVPSWSSAIREDRSALINHTQAGLGHATGIGARPYALHSLCLPVGDVITSMSLKHHQYADDTQLYFAVRASHYKDDLNIIEKCTSSVNDLLLNPTKSEVIAVGTATQRRTTISVGTVAVAGAPLSFVDNIRLLGVQIDSDLSFLMRKSMQFADRITIIPKLCNRSVPICRPILLRQRLVPSSVHFLTTITRSFTTSQRRTF